MCRIFGCFGRDSYETFDAAEIIKGLRHGGPDSHAASVHELATLGICRLAIIDPQGGNQPYTLEKGIEVVFNGEIYNHQELRTALRKKGYQFSDQCDGSIIPALYLEYGCDFVHHLDGMFAVAIFDQRRKPKIILAVDQLGIKPLYYHWNAKQKRLAFASELTALLEMNTIDPNIWPLGMDAYLTTKVITGKHTIYENIFSMLPGEMMIVPLDQSPKLSSWYSSESYLDVPDTFSDAAEGLSKILSEETSKLVRADVPIATINSGGLDSSLVTSLVSQTVSGVSSFHVAYVGRWPCDEKKYARELALRTQSDFHLIELDPREFRDLIPRVVKHMNQPHASPNTLSSYGLFRGISQAGYKVALSGDGADEMFGGYSRFSAAAANDLSYIPTYVDSLGAINKILRHQLYSSDYRAYLNDVGCTSDKIEHYLERSPRPCLSNLLEFERTVRLPAYHLRRVDHLSMAHAVEVRVPYCQRKILEYARKLNNFFLVDQDKVKRVLYKCAENNLPRSILQRPKQPFTLPIHAMMHPHQPLFSLVRECISLSSISQKGYFNPNAVLRLINLHRDKPSKKTSLALWALMIFELWAEQLKSRSTNAARKVA